MTNERGETIECPYASAADENARGIMSLDDESVFAVYSQDFPVEAAAVADLREKLERMSDEKVRQVADEAARSFVEGFFRTMCSPRTSSSPRQMACTSQSAGPQASIWITMTPLRSLTCRFCATLGGRVSW